MLRIIREEEPPKPSTRLSSIKRYRRLRPTQLEPKKLTTLVAGDLDWIVMKALEKDRNRRYETATGFAQDIQKYLADEPVLACPPSAGYKFRKFARKHRRALATAGAFIVLLVAGAVVSTWQAIRATQAEAAAKVNAEQAERNAQQARDEAKAKAAALVAEQKAREDETKAQQQASAVLLSLTADMVDKKYGSGTELTEDDQAFLQGLVAQSLVLARARQYVRLSQWGKAAAEYAHVDWSRPLHDDAFAYACLFLIRGDSQGYNDFCQRFIQRAAHMDDPEPYVLTRICAIAQHQPGRSCSNRPMGEPSHCRLSQPLGLSCVGSGTVSRRPI